MIPTDRHRHLPPITVALTEAGNRENFKRLLIPCAHYLDAAYRVCELLAEAYPDQRDSIAKVWMSHRIRNSVIPS
jgi:hypothetical protein